MKTRRTPLFFLLLLPAIWGIFSGCDRKNNPLMASPGGGVASTNLFIPQIDVTNSGDINRIFVYVTDGAGNPLTGFKLGNFSVVEGGEPGVPFEVGAVTDPLYCMLVIDRSGSMDGSYTTAANTAANSLIDALGGGDYVGLIEFDDVVQLTTDFTLDHAGLKSTISSSAYGGGLTAYYDAVLLGATSLNGRAGRRMLIALTDGMDNSSSATLDSCIANVNAAGQSVYPVGLGASFATGDLQRMATETGGTYAESDDGSDLTAIYLNILQKFNNLTYVKYRRRQTGNIKVYLNYGSLTANTTKTLD